MNYADYYRPPKAKRPTYSSSTPYMQPPQNYLHAMPSGSYNPARYQGLQGWGRPVGGGQGGGMNYQPPMGNGFQSYYQPPYGRPNSMYGRPSGQGMYGGGGAYIGVANGDGAYRRGAPMPSDWQGYQRYPHLRPPSMYINY